MFTVMVSRAGMGDVVYAQVPCVVSATILAEEARYRKYRNVRIVEPREDETDFRPPQEAARGRPAGSRRPT